MCACAQGHTELLLHFQHFPDSLESLPPPTGHHFALENEWKADWLVLSASALATSHRRLSFFLISRKSSGFFLPPLKTTTWTANASSTIRQLTLGGNVHRGHVKLRNEHGQTGFFLFRLQKCGRNEGQSSQQRNIESDELSNSAVATAPTAKTTDGKWKWRKCDTHVKLQDELTGRDGGKKSRNYLMMTLPSTDQPGWRWSGNVGGGLKECSWP